MKKGMKSLVVAAVLFCSVTGYTQEQKMNTFFDSKLKNSGGYGAISNKFSKIRGEFVNISGIYGGWFVNHRFMIGLAGEATTNNLKVPEQFSAFPGEKMTWQYGQFGLMTEYVIGSGRSVHLVLQGFGGAGFTLQYQRNRWHTTPANKEVGDENWFVVAEPGLQLEMNLFKWMRFSPGVSYRATFGSDGKGLEDKDLSGFSYGATLKFGKF